LKLQYSATTTATHRKPGTVSCDFRHLQAPKAGVSKHWPFDTHVDPTFLTGLYSMQEIQPQKR